jgi:hypothetical protein
MLVGLFSTALDDHVKKTNYFSYGLIFDGAGDYLALLLRGVEAGGWRLEQHLIAMQHLDSPYDSGVLNNILASHAFRVGVIRSKMVGLAHDDVEVNRKSAKELKSIWDHVSLSCRCHFLYHVGEKVAAPFADELASCWLAFFKNAGKRASLFSRITKKSFPSYNAIKVSIVRVHNQEISI